MEVFKEINKDVLADPGPLTVTLLPAIYMASVQCLVYAYWFKKLEGMTAEIQELTRQMRKDNEDAANRANVRGPRLRGM